MKPSRYAVTDGKTSSTPLKIWCRYVLLGFLVYFVTRGLMTDGSLSALMTPSSQQNPPPTRIRLACCIRVGVYTVTLRNTVRV